MTRLVRRGTMRALFAAGSTLLFSSVVFGSWMARDALASGPSLAPLGAVAGKEQERRGWGVLDGVTLVDQAGGRFSASRVEGDLVVLNFVFTECGTSCPVQTEQLAAVQRALTPAVRSRVWFVSVTVDPANDTPARLRAFAEAHHVDQTRWAFVTGSPEELGRLTRRFEVFAANGADAKTGFHTTDIRLVDRHGMVVQRYAGSPVDQARLRREIEALASATVAERRP